MASLKAKKLTADDCRLPVRGNLLVSNRRIIYIFITLKLKTKWNQVNSYIGEW